MPLWRGHIVGIQFGWRTYRMDWTLERRDATNMVVVRLSASPFSFRSSMAFWAPTWRRQFLWQWNWQSPGAYPNSCPGYSHNVRSHELKALKDDCDNYDEGKTPTFEVPQWQLPTVWLATHPSASNAKARFFRKPSASHAAEPVKLWCFFVGRDGRPHKLTKSVPEDYVDIIY